MSASLVNTVLSLPAAAESLETIRTFCLSSSTSRNLSSRSFHGLHRNLTVRVLIFKVAVNFLKSLEKPEMFENGRLVTEYPAGSVSDDEEASLTI